VTAQWIPIALGRDVPVGATRSVSVEDRELVIWRGSDGDPHVWEDRCPHRGMRLSFGFVRDNALNCLYHGWQYGAGSQCLRIPAHPDLSVPPSIRANAHASAEAGGMIWTRMDNRSEVPLPDLPERGEPLLTLAVDAELDDIRSAAGQNAQVNGAQLLTLAHAHSVLHLGWHRAGKGKTMLHVIIESGEKAVAIGLLRNLRSLAEGEMAI